MMGGSDKSNFFEIVALNYTQHLKFQGHNYNISLSNPKKFDLCKICIILFIFYNKLL